MDFDYKLFSYKGQVNKIPKSMLFYVYPEDLKKNLYLVYPKVEVLNINKNEMKYLKRIKKFIDGCSIRDYFWYK